MWKFILVFGLSLSLIVSNQPTIIAHSSSSVSLNDLVKKPYLELLELNLITAPSKKEIDDFKQHLEAEKEREKNSLKQDEKQLKKQRDQLRKQLAELNKRTSYDTVEIEKERRALHCHILKLEHEIAQKQTERTHGVAVVYDNMMAKLDLIQHWPAKRRGIATTLAAGLARERRYGDVEDIGIREIGKGQENDIRLGEEAIQQLKAQGLMPPELENKELKDYIQQLAETIAASSDLKIPIRVTLLDSDEINAFALPGGFLFINRGLIEKAETESELVGVMAHEIAHISARHGAKLMKRATIASIFYQAAQMAALILTGGTAGIGIYYALQYGFFGLGMVLELSLLGVSREYETEADQLGVQYAWHAGYDPRGFITFFDKMASEKGYIKSASFFRTHPPFFDRIVSTFAEIEFLPKKEELKVDTSTFQQAKQQLKEFRKEIKPEKRPMLKRVPECDEEKVKLSLIEIDARGSGR
ncbi:MAG: M48 family metalloprotease [Acidobacteriota bacterium]